MARFHEFDEKVEIEVFTPVHEYIWEKYVQDSDIDGISAFYYAMEYIDEHFPAINVTLAFQIAENIMQEAWDVHIDRMRADFEKQSAANNYEAWTEDDLPW